MQKNLDRQIGSILEDSLSVRLRNLNSVLPVFAKPLRAFEHSYNIVRLLLFKKIILKIFERECRYGKHESGKSC